MDACFHTRAFIRSETDLDYRLYLIELAFEYIEESENVVLSRQFNESEVNCIGTIPPRYLKIPKPKMLSILKHVQEQGIFLGKWRYQPEFRLTKNNIFIIVEIVMPSTDVNDWKLEIQTDLLMLNIKDKLLPTSLFSRINVHHKDNKALFYKKSKHLVVWLVLGENRINPEFARTQYI
ncbi:hypothetical protein BDF14DRAFT_24437 [Spinellus fusiger]|nr:hypothetical protein BDF14DRAFT_24437 [Spinellus fusiger]